MFGFSQVMMAAKSGFDPSTPLGTFVADQGGYYIGVIVDGGKNFALFLANKAEGQNNALAWKPAAGDTPGTSSFTNGLANLAAMVTAGIAAHPAGQFCVGLMIGGFTDWYFPAVDELAVIYTNRTSIVGIDAIDADATFYWSSTQNDAALGQAFRRRFSDNFNNAFGKVNTYRVRAVRRLEIAA